MCVQALSKARRTQDARRFALCAETTRVSGGADDEVGSSWGSGSRPRVERRVLADDEPVYSVQATWRNSAGKFILVERKKAAEVRSARSFVCVIYKCTCQLFVYLFVYTTHAVGVSLENTAVIYYLFNSGKYSEIWHFITVYWSYCFFLFNDWINCVIMKQVLTLVQYHCILSFQKVFLHYTANMSCELGHTALLIS